jgi:hypothetical protein
MRKQNLNSLISLVQQLKDYIIYKDLRNEGVSSSDVAWQIDHSLKVINFVSERLINSDPMLYESRFNRWRFLFFNLNYFPRGKVRAPKSVSSSEMISSESLSSQFQQVYQNIKKIKTADKNAHFRHFIFGVLHKQRTIHFLNLHTNHHLKIIKDIV